MARLFASGAFHILLSAVKNYSLTLGKYDGFGNNYWHWTICGMHYWAIYLATALYSSRYLYNIADGQENCSNINSFNASSHNVVLSVWISRKREATTKTTFKLHLN